MLVKERSIRDLLPSFGDDIIGFGARRRVRSALIAVAKVIAALALLVVILAGIRDLYRHGPHYVEVLWRGSTNWLASTGAAPASVNIDINFENYQRLAFERQCALQKGVIIQHDRSYVPARLELEDRAVDVKPAASRWRSAYSGRSSP